MKRNLIIILLAISACKEKPVTPATVINSLQVSNKMPLADGSTILDISVAIDPKADADKRSVIFRASAGTFLPSNDTTITQTAAFENGQLIARVKYKVPQTAGMVIIKARPATQNQLTNYMLADTLNVQSSLPAKLSLLPSSLGIKTGFTSEISLVATLKNSQGGNISLGSKVIFEQLPPGMGVFRVQRDSTDATSTATASFTAGSTPFNTAFYIRCTYIDPFGNPSLTIKDSCLINVTN